MHNTAWSLSFSNFTERCKRHSLYCWLFGLCITYSTMVQYLKLLVYYLYEPLDLLGDKRLFIIFAWTYLLPLSPPFGISSLVKQFTRLFMRLVVLRVSSCYSLEGIFFVPENRNKTLWFCLLFYNFHLRTFHWSVGPQRAFIRLQIYSIHQTAIRYLPLTLPILYLPTSPPHILSVFDH